MNIVRKMWFHLTTRVEIHECSLNRWGVYKRSRMPFDVWTLVSPRFNSRKKAEEYKSNYIKVHTIW